jgi:ring-1,2-phenylacetyl-CoA epoxidase subunit PaaE
MSKFHPLKVKQVVRETDDAVAISFEIPEELKADYIYIQGQYLTIEQEIGGEKVRRAYSLCSSPVGNEAPTVCVKRVEGGKMSTHLNKTCKSGDILNVMIPEGRFYTPIDSAQSKQYFLFGGGSGITPLLSIIKTVLIAEPKSKCVLLYANKNKNSIIFKDQLDKLKESNKGRFEVVYSLDSAGLFWSGLKGIITADTVQKHVNKFKDNSVRQEYFICGPGGMMQVVQSALNGMNLPKENIHVEYFTTPGSENKKPAEPVASDAQAFSGTTQLTVTIDGKTVSMSATAKKTILNAAQDAGLDPPYSCESGICSTCMAKVTEGTVRMIENNILTEKEIAAGYVLTCQALCTSPVVKVEYYD